MHSTLRILACLLLLGCNSDRATNPNFSSPTPLQEDNIAMVGQQTSAVLLEVVQRNQGVYRGREGGTVQVQEQRAGYLLLFTAYSEDGLLYLTGTTAGSPLAGALRFEATDLFLGGQYAAHVSGTWMVDVEGGTRGCWDVQQEGQADQQLCF